MGGSDVHFRADLVGLDGKPRFLREGADSLIGRTIAAVSQLPSG